MKKIIMGIALLAISVFSRGQGLDSLIVEKYYISNSADQAGAGGNGDALPVGSFTYRIYVDMPPQCKFQAAYGVNGTHPHTTIFTTTTSFYNNTNRGAEAPTYTKVQAAGNTTMIDSW